MREDDEIDRIEVQLFATEGDPSSPFPGPADRVGPSPASTSAPGRRPRLALALGIAGVVAATVLGWAVARSGVDDAAPAPSTPVSLEASGAAQDPTASSVGGRAPRAGGRAVDASPLVPMAPVTPALGDAEALVEKVVGVSAVLASQQVEIVAYGNGRRLVRLDLSTGVVRTQVVQRHAFGRARVLVGGDWVLLPTTDPDLPSLVVLADGTVELVDVGTERVVLGVSDLEQVWLADREVAADGGAVEAVTREGVVLGSIDLPGPPAAFDPRGGFVVEGADGVVQVTAKATAPIGSGALLALGADIAVVVECAEPAPCAVAVIDRTTGERRVVQPFTAGAGEPPELAPVGGESVARSGRHAMVAILNPAAGSSPQTMLATLDLDSGEVVEVGRAQDVDESVWSPDGRFLFYNGGGRIRAHDVTTAQDIDVAAQLVAVESFGIRPPLPDDGF